MAMFQSGGSGCLGHSLTQRVVRGSKGAHPSKKQRNRTLSRVGTKDDAKNGAGKKTTTIVDAVVFRMAEVLGMMVMDGSDTMQQRFSENIVEDSSPSFFRMEEVERKIENLYQSSYFFSGQGSEDDWAVFADSCVFADEFSSFVGAGRFRRNVTNFGKFLRNPECTLTRLERVQCGDGTLSIKASWIFRARVKWINGLLAAAGETTYVVSAGRIVRHDEAWKTPKSTVFKNLFFNTVP